MKKIFALIVAVTIFALLVTSTWALLSISQNIPLTGTVAGINVGVFSDAACTIPVTSLAIGTINPGSVATQTMYIQNTGTVQETLTMSNSGWVPANATSVLTLSWNRQNYVLPAGQSIQAILSLTAAANTGSLTTFSCNVTITGTQ